jgi:hypothetical protein
VKLWAKLMTAAECDSLDIGPLMGENELSVIHVKTETRKGKGDRVTFNLRARLTGAGKTENETAAGQGASLSIYSDNVFINELGHIAATKSEHTIDAQRVLAKQRREPRSRRHLGTGWHPGALRDAAAVPIRSSRPSP